jgi:hypothetical protein
MRRSRAGPASMASAAWQPSVSSACEAATSCRTRLTSAPLVHPHPPPAPQVSSCGKGSLAGLADWKPPAAVVLSAPKQRQPKSPTRDHIDVYFQQIFS